jgi:hypothetical protein
MNTPTRFSTSPRALAPDLAPTSPVMKFASRAVSSRPAVPRRLGAAAAFALTSAGLAQYTFDRIDVPGSLVAVYPGNLNNHGEVAFTGFHFGGSMRVYKGSGGPLTVIALTGSSPFTYFNAPSINCAGDVGFRALTNNSNGIYRGNGGPLTLIHGAAAPSNVLGGKVDEDGTVTVWYEGAMGYDSIATGSGGPLTGIAAQGFVFNGLDSYPDIRLGTVAFAADLTSGGSAIYTSASGVLTQVEASGSQFLDTQVPRIGCSGSVVWISNVLGGTQAIRTHVNGVTSTFVDTSGPYQQFGLYGVAWINFFNEVAFTASLDSDNSVGIFVGPNPVTDKVIAQGDVLDGQVVRFVALGGLNDFGQISLSVGFADDTWGVYRANPPLSHADPGCCARPRCGTADFDNDGDIGTDADIDAFFACLGGNCCAQCWSGGADFNGDGDVGTDADIESFFRVLAGGPC